MTTHHVLKLVALGIMTIDHVGAFLYPDMLWWRAVGRVTFPVWFFLIGNAPTRPVSRDLLLWAVALAVLNPFLGKPLFPLNALVTIACCIWTLRLVERKALLDREPVMLVAASLLFLLPSEPLMEYGTQGFLYALMGYAVREQKMDWRRGKLVTVTALLLFLAVQSQSYDFSAAQQAVMMGGTMLVTLGLMRFTYRPVSIGLPWANAPLRWLARHTLQYYVVHRVLLQAAGIAKGTLSAGFRWI